MKISSSNSEICKASDCVNLHRCNEYSSNSISSSTWWKRFLFSYSSSYYCTKSSTSYLMIFSTCSSWSTLSVSHGKFNWKSNSAHYKDPWTWKHWNYHKIFINHGMITTRSIYIQRTLLKVDFSFLGNFTVFEHACLAIHSWDKGESIKASSRIFCAVN